MDYYLLNIVVILHTAQRRHSALDAECGTSSGYFALQNSGMTVITKQNEGKIMRAEIENYQSRIQSSLDLLARSL